MLLILMLQVLKQPRLLLLSDHSDSGRRYPIALLDL